MVEKTEPAEAVREKVEEIIQKTMAEGISLDPVTIFDVFSGKGLSENQKSIAFSSASEPMTELLVRKKLTKPLRKSSKQSIPKQTTS